MYAVKEGVLTYGNGNYESWLKLENLDRLTKPNLKALFKNIKSMITDAEWHDLKGHVFGVKAKEAYAKADGKGANMTKFKKAEFYWMDSERGAVVKAKGYEFTAETGRKLYIYKNADTKMWHITDPRTGASLTRGSTREDAIAKAMVKHEVFGKDETMTAFERYEDMQGVASYEERARRFEELMEARGEAPKDYTVATTDHEGKAAIVAEVHHENLTKEETMSKTAKPAPKPKAKKAAPKTNAAPNPKPAPKPKAQPNPEAKHEPAKEPAAMLRYKAIESPWEGVAVTQKREGCCIWVSGDTKPYANELKTLGYKWSRKRKAWWKQPEVA